MQVVVCGVSTSGGVEATASQAYELGYNAVLVLDAMTDHEAGDHEFVVRGRFPKIGESGSTRDVLEQLDARE